MRILNDVDPTTNPFNEFMKNYGYLVAIGIAVVVLIVVVLLFILSSKKKKNDVISKPSISFDSNSVIEALGGKENIVDTQINGSRISISLSDTTKVNEVSLKENSVKSIIKMSNKITLLVEGDPKEFYARVFKSSEL